MLLGFCLIASTLVVKLINTVVTLRILHFSGARHFPNGGQTAVNSLLLLRGSGAPCVLGVVSHSAPKRVIVTMSKPSRRGLYECVCGKVKADVLVPSPGFGRVEPISIMCSCRDCVGFTNAVVEASKTHFDGKTDAPDVEGKHLVTDRLGATHYVVLHDSEVTLSEGLEHIRVLKLKEKTSVRRLYAACCGTPLGSAQTMTGLHPQLMKPHPDKTDDQVDFPFLKPTVCIHIESAPEGSVPEGVNATKGAPPGLIFKFLSKLSVAPFRKNASNSLRNETSTIAPTVGIDSIALES